MGSDTRQSEASVIGSVATPKASAAASRSAKGAHPQVQNHAPKQAQNQVQNQAPRASRSVALDRSALDRSTASEREPSAAAAPRRVASLRLEQLAHDRSEHLLARVRSMLGPRARRAAESLDFAQDAWLELLQSPTERSGQDESDVLRRLCAIARNNARDAARRCVAPRLESLLAAEVGAAQGAEACAADAFAAEQTSPSSILGRDEELRLLVAKTQALAPELRQIVELRCLEGLTFPEIAARVSRNEDTVRKAYYRAVVQLSQRS